MAEQLDAGLYQLIVERGPDAMVLADHEGVIRLWNRAAEALFGHTADEALGQSLDIIVPERFRENHWTGFRRAMAEGATKYVGRVLPTRSITKGGSTIYLDMTLTILRDDGGHVQGALAILRDITERRAQERATTERIAELERRLGEAGQAQGG